MNVRLRNKLYPLLSIHTLCIIAIIAGSALPDFDVLWHSHRGWTHNILVPISVLFIVVGAYIGGQSKSWFLGRANAK